MTVTVHPRAEIALGYLAPKEQQTFRQSLQRLQTHDRESLASTGLLKALTGPAKGLYAFRASQGLRAVLSVRKNGWVVEDVVRPARIERLLGRGEKQ